MRGKAVPRRMWRYPLFDPAAWQRHGQRGSGGVLTAAQADCGRETACRAAAARPGIGLRATSYAALRAAAVTAMPGGLYDPPLSRGQAFALLDPQQHAFGVDIADL